jgi:hypothetical protein
MIDADEQTYLTQTGPRINERAIGTTSQKRKPDPLENIQSDGGNRYQEIPISAGEGINPSSSEVPTPF